MDKQEAMSMLSCSVDSNSLALLNRQSFTQSDGTTYPGEAVLTGEITCWDYWQNCYYPYVIYPSYPVYMRERALDRGKQAFEIIKILKDKKIVKLEKVADFIDLMDELIKIL